MTELEYFEMLLGPKALSIYERGEERQDMLLADVPDECFLVGQSFCAKHGIPRYHRCDGLVHIGATKEDYPRLRVQYPEYRIHIVRAYTTIEALRCLCGGDNPVSLKCTFDYALRYGFVTMDEVDALLTREGSFRGKPILVEVRPFLKDCFDSPLESMSHVFFNLHGFREPEMQVWIGEENRCDFLWRKTISKGRVTVNIKGNMASNPSYKSTKSTCETTIITSKATSSITISGCTCMMGRFWNC
jgi:hypothetical protein